MTYTRYCPDIHHLYLFLLRKYLSAGGSRSGALLSVVAPNNRLPPPEYLYPVAATLYYALYEVSTFAHYLIFPAEFTPAFCIFMVC